MNTITEIKNDQLLNAEVERLMTVKLYEVDDSFGETIYTTEDKEEAEFLAHMIINGRVHEIDMVSGECTEVENDG